MRNSPSHATSNYLKISTCTFTCTQARIRRHQWARVQAQAVCGTLRQPDTGQTTNLSALMLLFSVQISPYLCPLKYTVEVSPFYVPPFYALCPKRSVKSRKSIPHRRKISNCPRNNKKYSLSWNLGRTYFSLALLVSFDFTLPIYQLKILQVPENRYFYVKLSAS